MCHSQFNHGALELGCGQMTETVLEKGANTFLYESIKGLGAKTTTEKKFF